MKDALYILDRVYLVPSSKYTVNITNARDVYRYEEKDRALEESGLRKHGYS